MGDEQSIWLHCRLSVHRWNHFFHLANAWSLNAVHYDGEDIIEDLQQWVPGMVNDFDDEGIGGGNAGDNGGGNGGNIGGDGGNNGGGNGGNVGGDGGNNGGGNGGNVGGGGGNNGGGNGGNGNQEAVEILGDGFNDDDDGEVTDEVEAAADEENQAAADEENQAAADEVSKPAAEVSKAAGEEIAVNPRKRRRIDVPIY